MVQFLLRCLLAIFGAAIATIGLFAVVKTVFGWPAGGFRDNAILLLGIGAVIAVHLLFLEFLRFRRQLSAERFAAEWSLRYSATGNEELAKRFGQLVAPRDFALLGEKRMGFDLENVVQGPHDGFHLLIGDLNTLYYLEGNDRDQVQTIINIRGRDLSLPSLSLHLTTADEPTVAGETRRYRLVSDEPTVTQDLLNESLARFLSGISPQDIHVTNQQLVLVHDGLVPVARWKALADEAIQIVARLTESVARIKASQTNQSAIH